MTLWIILSAVVALFIALAAGFMAFMYGVRVLLIFIGFAFEKKALGLSSIESSIVWLTALTIGALGTVAIAAGHYAFWALSLFP